MTEHRSNQYELADRLDMILPPGRSAAALAVVDNDPLVNAALWLAGAPYPTIPAAQKARILEQVLAARPQAFPTPKPHRWPLTPSTVAVIGGLALTATVVAWGIISLTSPSGQDGEPGGVGPQTFTPVSTVAPAAEIIGPLTETPVGEMTPEITATVEVDMTGDMGDEVIMVVEGPVSEINGSVIVIYGFEFTLGADDPLLAVIQPGDVLRIEGGVVEEDGDFSMVVVTLTFVDAEVYVSDDGAVWRDSGDCNGAPPPWAPAHGWRRRCEGDGAGSGRPAENPNSRNGNDKSG